MTGMKTCKRCEQVKDFLEFYSADNSCKDCRKALVRKYREDNLAKCQAYDRSRGNRPERVKARKEYAATQAGKEKTARAKLAWADRNQFKRRAHYATSNAIRDGKLIRQPCEVCGIDPAEAHHDDYSKPLEVRWLCTAHHAEHHKQERENAREEQSWP